MRKNIAILLAGGSGKRFGQKCPKQLITIAGKTIFEHTLAIFDTHPQIDEIAVVAHPDYKERIAEISSPFKKVTTILSGGKERSDSSLAAIHAYSHQEVNLIFHDVVRPLVTQEMIANCIAALEEYTAVTVATKTTDTIALTKNKKLTSFLNRNSLYNIQTPQAFHWETIHKAYQKATQDPNFQATDDCGIVKKYLPNEEISIVEGSPYNLKLTYREDLLFLETLLRENAKQP